MSNQQTWSRQTKTNGTMAAQRANTPSTGSVVEVRAKIIAVRQNGTKLECLIEPERDLPSTKGIWFPFHMSGAEFASMFGTIETFANLYEKPNGLFSYRSPSLSTGRVSLRGQETVDLKAESKSVSTSIAEVVLGISDSSYRTERTFKAIGSKNTAIKLNDNKIRLTTDNGFLEASDKGLTLGGSINYQSLPSEGTHGMVLKMQNPFLGMLPSTAVTPIPQYTFKLPIEQIKLTLLLFSVATSFIK